MCSSYDYSTEAVEELTTKTEKFMDEILEDKWCRYLFNELEIKG